MEEGGAAIGRDLQDLFDQVLDLSPVQWGFVGIAAAAAFAWIWVMGGPKDERRPVVAGMAAAIVGVGVGLALVLLHPHRWSASGRSVSGSAARTRSISTKIEPFSSGQVISPDPKRL